MTLALHLVTSEPAEPPPEAEKKRPLHDWSVTIPPAARHAFTDLEGRMAALRRVFAGPSATVATYAEIGRLADEIRTAAERVKRGAR